MPHADTSDLHPRPDVPVADPHDPARIARNKAVASRISRASTTGDQASCVEFVASDYVDHPPAKFFNVPFTDRNAAGRGACVQRVFPTWSKPSRR